MTIKTTTFAKSFRQRIGLALFTTALVLGFAGIVSGDDADGTDDSLANVIVYTDAPWGELGDAKGGNSREFGPIDYPVAIPKKYTIDETITGKNNLKMDGTETEVYYGEEDSIGEYASQWAYLQASLSEGAGPSYGRNNWAYAYAGPGWRTTIVASVGLYKIGSFLPPKTIFRRAECKKQVVCDGSQEPALWKFSWKSAMHLQAACTAAQTVRSDLAVGIAVGQLKFDAWDDGGHVIDQISTGVVISYSDDWFERQQTNADTKHPYATASTDADGVRHLGYDVAGGGTVSIVSAAEDDVPDGWGVITKEKISEIDRFVRQTIEIGGTWSTTAQMPYCIFRSKGSAFVEQDGGGTDSDSEDDVDDSATGAGGEWSQAMATQRAIPGAHKRKTLIRVYLERKNDDGSWEKIDSTENWVAQTSVPSTGPQEETETDGVERTVEVHSTESGGHPDSFLDKVTKVVYVDGTTEEVIHKIIRDNHNDSEDGGTDTEAYENVRLVKVYQKERNAGFLNDGYWEVTIESFDKTAQPIPALVKKHIFE